MLKAEEEIKHLMLEDIKNQSSKEKQSSLTSTNNSTNKLIDISTPLIQDEQNQNNQFLIILYQAIKEGDLKSVEELLQTPGTRYNPNMECFKMEDGSMHSLISIAKQYQEDIDDLKNQERSQILDYLILPYTLLASSLQHLSINLSEDGFIEVSGQSAYHY